MKWWIHLIIYVLGSFFLFFAVGVLIIVKFRHFIPFVIFILPVPIIVFHLLWKKVNVSCVNQRCEGSMQMSSVGSLYYKCEKCGELKRTIIKRSPQNR